MASNTNGQLRIPEGPTRLAAGLDPNQTKVDSEVARVGIRASVVNTALREMSVAARMETWAAMFPSLHGRPGIRPWDPAAFYEWLGTDGPAAFGGSTAAWASAGMVLRVWNPAGVRDFEEQRQELQRQAWEAEDVPSWRRTQFRVPTVVEGMLAWDPTHRAAALAYLVRPWGT